jgi:hypothetical protein
MGNDVVVKTRNEYNSRLYGLSSRKFPKPLS